MRRCFVLLSRARTQITSRQPHAARERDASEINIMCLQIQALQGKMAMCIYIYTLVGSFATMPGLEINFSQINQRYANSLVGNGAAGGIPFEALRSPIVCNELSSGE